MERISTELQIYKDIATILISSSYSRLKRFLGIKIMVKSICQQIAKRVANTLK